MVALRPPDGTPGYGPSVVCQFALTMLLTRLVVPQLGALLGVEVVGSTHQDSSSNEVGIIQQGLDVYIELLCTAAGMRLASGGSARPAPATRPIAW